MRITLVLIALAVLASPSSATKRWDAVGIGDHDVSWGGGSGTLTVGGTFGGATVTFFYCPPHSNLSTCLEIDSAGCTFTVEGFCDFFKGQGDLRLTVTGGTPTIDAVAAGPTQASAGMGGGGGSDFWIDDGTTGSGLVPGSPDAIQITNNGAGSGNVVEFLADTTGQTENIFEVRDNLGDLKMAMDNSGTLFIDHQDTFSGPRIRFFDGTFQDSWQIAVDDTAAGGVVIARASSEFFIISTTGVTLGIGSGPQIRRLVASLTVPVFSVNSNTPLVGMGGTATLGSLINSNGESALQWGTASVSVQPGITLGTGEANSPPFDCTDTEGIRGQTYYDLNQDNGILCVCKGGITTWQGMTSGGGAAVTCT